MRRRGLRRQLLICGAIGAVIGIVAAVAGLTNSAPSAVLTIAVMWILATAYVRLRVRYTLPRKALARMLEVVDASVGPPSSAEPVTLELADRYAAVNSSRDRGGLAGVLDESYTYSSRTLGRTVTKKKYVRGAAVMKLAFKSQPMTVDAVVADPGVPDVVWIRLTQVCRAYRGPDLDSTWWERWTVTPDRQRILASELLGITRVS